VIGVDVQLAGNLVANVSANTLKISGVVSGTGSLTKTGVGTLSLTAANSYSGDTIVQVGTLSLATASLADTADVYLTSGGQLQLNFGGGPDGVDSLFINGISQRAGIWGAIGSGAQFTSPLITGSGELQVFTFLPAALVGDYNQDGIVDSADYTAWRNSVGTTSLPNRAAGNTGAVGQADYDAWRMHFGQTVFGSGAGVAASVVPEPGCAGLASLLMLSLGLKRARSPVGANLGRDERTSTPGGKVG
jgi:autotransporter-associated beta strand protein